MDDESDGDAPGLSFADRSACEHRSLLDRLRDWDGDESTEDEELPEWLLTELSAANKIGINRTLYFQQLDTSMRLCNFIDEHSQLGPVCADGTRCLEIRYAPKAAHITDAAGGHDFVSQFSAASSSSPGAWSFAQRNPPGGAKVSVISFGRALFPGSALVHVYNDHNARPTPTFYAAHVKCCNKDCVNPEHLALMDSSMQINAELGCPGGDDCFHGDGGLCAASGTAIDYPIEYSHLGSVWCDTGTPEQHTLKQQLLARIQNVYITVDYVIPEWATDLYSVAAADILERQCFELPLDSWPNFVFGYPFFRGITLVSFFFTGHEQHRSGTGVGSWHAVHRCHNAACVRPSHVYLAPKKVNFGTSACPGGSACLHNYSCLFPGSQSHGWEPEAAE